MIVTYKKNLAYKYTCEICGNQFNCNNQSSYFGTFEKPDFVFCSDGCKTRHKELQKESKMFYKCRKAINKLDLDLSE